jgi:hypothetical protein
MNRALSGLFALLMATAAWADTTSNLLTNSWSGISVSGDLGGQHPITVFGQTTSFGSGPFLDNSTGNVNGQTGQIIWSYSQATVSQIIAVNQALSGAGIVISGYNWGYELRNMNGDDRQGSVDTLTATSWLRASNGATLLSATQTYNTKQEWNWHGGTVSATSPYALTNVGQVGIQFTSADSGFWGGYYGPQVRNVSLSLNYSVDQCAANPLSSPECPGYQQAYLTQQCTANPLYDSSCPGYATAYHDQQCAANPLYALTCAGYQQAYYNQQCSINPLWDSTCPGYQQAYYNQQCADNPLYDSGCANYTIVLAATQPPSIAAEPVASAQVNETTATEPASTTSATSPTSVSPAAVVSVVNPPPAPVAADTNTKSVERENARAETKAAEQRAEEKKTQQAVSRAVAKTTPSQAAQEAAESSASATSIEAQQAAQNLVLGLMGYNPAFSAYQNAIVPDVNAAVMARQYNQPTVDNRRALRALSGASDRMHQDMVDQQYGRMQ